MLNCASLFADVVDCTYRSAVTLTLLCLIRLWISFRSAPLSFRRVPNEWRSVCQPIRFVIPARIAAGLMCFSSAVFGQSGCVPFFFVEENTKFSAWLYAHSARQFMRTSARSDSSGTGFLL